VFSRNPATTVIQKVLLGTYAGLQRTGIFRTTLGAAIFDRAYAVYKATIEARSLRYLQRFVPAGSSVVDVGANIGTFTLQFAEWTQKHGRVIAIEPENVNFDRLKRRVQKSNLSGCIELRRAAATDHDGEVFLRINPLHPGDHRLAASGLSVDAVTLDSVVDGALYPAVSLIKIDVQGAEMKVLRGSARLLERDQPALFIEIDNNALTAQGSSETELFAWLQERGYQGYHLDADGRTVPLAPSGSGARSYYDALFLKA
jgi:FkbM family methyltransferase